MSRGHPPKWKSPELLAAIEARYDGKTETISTLVAEFNVPRHAVNSYARLLNKAQTKSPNWTEKEENFLINNWSERGLEYCAKRLKRSKVAVNIKAKRLGLGGVVKGSQYLSAQSVANILGIDVHSVLRWLDKGQLQYKSAPFSDRVDGRRTVTMVSLVYLETFLQTNLDLWDSRKMKGSLWLQDPEWFVNKRAADRSRPINEGRKWSRDEDKRVISLFKRGTMTYHDIGSQLGRSGDSVERRLSRLDIWGTGEFMGAKHERNKGGAL